MNEKQKERLIKRLQRHCVEDTKLYRDRDKTGFISTSFSEGHGSSIHLREEVFIELFRGKQYEITDDGSNDYPIKLEFLFNGITWFALLQREKYEAMFEPTEVNHAT